VSCEQIEGGYICRPDGKYIGQIRARAARTWRNCNDTTYTRAEEALAAAVLAMGSDDHRARALWIDTGEGYYEPHVAMEATR
jgi:hypothetical protein